MALVFLFGISTASFGQNKYAIGFFRSFPTGKFKSTSLDNSGSFAKNGWGAVFEDKVRTNSWPAGFYMLIHLSYQQNQLDNMALQENLTASLGYRTAVAEANYNPLLASLGPYFEILLSKATYLGIKTGIGFMFTNIDSFVISAYDTQGNMVFNELLDFKSSPNFSFLLGLQFGVRLSRNVELGCFADYSAGRQRVKATIGNLSNIQSDFNLAFVNTGLNVTVSF
ncbi:hypothetical protein [Chryseolinea soli]|nr:hypothetical protein [Chryseolinea soli]